MVRVPCALTFFVQTRGYDEVGPTVLEQDAEEARKTLAHARGSECVHIFRATCGTATEGSGPMGPFSGHFGTRLYVLEQAVWFGSGQLVF